MVRTKKWRSEPCGLNVTISASCDWSVAIFAMSLESQESYLTLRNLTLQITRDFFRLHSTFVRLYNAAASPASRLRSAGSLATIAFIWRENMLGYLSADIICSEKRTFFRERGSRKTVSLEAHSQNCDDVLLMWPLVIKGKLISS